MGERAVVSDTANSSESGDYALVDKWCSIHGGFASDIDAECSERRRMDSGFAYIRCVYRQPAEDQR